MAFAKFDKIENSVASFDASTRLKFIAKVYNILGIGLLASIATGFLTYLFLKEPTRGLLYGLSGAWFLIVLISGFIQPRSSGLAGTLFGIFALVAGAFFGIIARVLVDVGLGMIFAQAAILTVAVFGGLTAYVHITKKDFSFLMGFMVIFWVILLAFGIMTIFMRSNMMSLIYSAGGVAFFSLWILFDTSRIIHKAEPGEEIYGAFMLFIDIAYLFWFILDILLRLASDN